MRRPDSDRDRAFRERPRSNYLWCLHCERGSERGKWRMANDLQLCPYGDCSGDTVLDGMDWEEIRDYYPEYPVAPKWGDRYPSDPTPEGRQRVVRAASPLSRDAASAKARDLGAAVAAQGPGPLSEALEPGSGSEYSEYADLSLADEIWCSGLEKEPTWWLIIRPNESYPTGTTTIDFRGCLGIEEARVAWEAGWRQVDP